MLTRRQLMKRGALGAGGLMLPGILRQAPALAAPSPAGSLAKFIDPLPRLTENAIDVRGGGTVELTAKQFSQQLHSQLPPTPLFGYARSSDGVASYPGPALLAREGTATRVKYTSALPAQPPPWLNPGATLTSAGGYDQFAPVKHGIRGEVRMLTHLHGGFVLGRDDGNPAAGIVPERDADGNIVRDADGNLIPAGDYRDGFASGEVQWADYPFDQPASLLWYHDHYLGDTRMNVVAGLAGGCIVTNGVDTFDGDDPVRLPMGAYDIPLVVQDKQFTLGGEILYPFAPATANGPWIGEYFGDCMLVNGRIWPKLTVEPAIYRFRVLNGCNARILNLDLGGVPMYVIGSEGGFLPLGTGPVPVRQIVMAPAERFDVIVDFRRFAGKTLLLRNGKPPAPVVTPAPALSQVMQILVSTTASAGAPSILPAVSPGPLDSNGNPLEDLRSLGAPLSAPDVRPRVFALNEIGPNTPSWFLNINGDRFDPETTDELERDGVEDWIYVNLTGDTHPMHTHLFTFQVMGRFPFNAVAYMAAYGTATGATAPDKANLTPADLFVTGPMIPPAPEEVGWKDTVKANPGQITVVRTRLNLHRTAGEEEQRYVHHCHIVEHEDNDMMRTFTVS